ncbi:sulfatase [Lutimonas saemankumensis]|uniref:sulfatase n=1 Tax=Lutimonas saemankumensis TaxID=483016 RepID=UPI001CD6882A|nr:sulfatase [Lutimonas saemankumensis]MCA0932504.1 sulfatase [Lutimonas saemankumensis]
MKYINTFQLFKLLILLLFLRDCKAQSDNSVRDHPNVLFIMVDDLNDYQGVYGGHPQALTPSIDNFAKSATVFTNAHTNSPVCQPSRNSLFTGVYPHNSRDFGWTPHFRQAVLKHNKTFIELFKENGYQTLGTGKLLHKNVKKYWDQWGIPEGINYGPHAFSGIDEKGKRIMGHSSVPEPFRSINVVDGSFAPLSDTPVIPDGKGGFKKTGWTYGNRPYRYNNDDDRDLLPDERHAQWISGKIKELDDQGGSEPFFMGVGFVNPHTPLYAPQKYFDLFPLESIQMPVVQDGDVDDIFYQTVYAQTEMGLAYYRKLKQSYPNGDEGLRRFLQAYLACVAFVDDQIGIVLDALNHSRFRDNTIVILVSDHGWQMGEKAYLYKNSPWDESTRIPFIIRDPRLSDPVEEIDHAVSLIDLYPTLIELCELQANDSAASPLQMDGFSLKPFLADAKTSDWEGPRGALTVLGAGINKPIEGIGVSKNPGALWHIEIINDLDTSYVKKQNYTYRTKDWRYILYHNGKEEMYYHPDDPYEWVNLAGEEKFSDMKIRLRSEMMEMIDSDGR